jgi:hypothetical protein
MEIADHYLLHAFHKHTKGITYTKQLRQFHQSHQQKYSTAILTINGKPGVSLTVKRMYFFYSFLCLSTTAYRAYPCSLA